MVTCKDCVHHEVCFNYVIGDEVERCDRFKNIADVAEVKHGHWMTYYCTNGGQSIRGRTIRYRTYTCDACGKANGRHKTNYCSNCGAKMDGGEK